jgi:SAM-dependent methyltransferase
MFRHLIPPFHLTRFSARDAASPLNYLDVGCGNHMPRATKRRFPLWNYYGLDRADYNIDARDKAAMTGHYALDLESGSLDAVPAAFFDVVVMSHVIEHLPNGLEVLAALTEKLRPGGRIYVEFPSVRSLALPPMKGTLNFSDDPTHVRVYGVREISNLLMSRGFRILRAGRRRHWMRILLLPLIVTAKFALGGRPEAGDFWDVAGFADYVFARKAGGAG